jgi:hypothetical protein
MAYDAEQWHDFATSLTGAAGALPGLAFVAISLKLDAILRYKCLPGRAIGTRSPGVSATSGPPSPSRSWPSWALSLPSRAASAACTGWQAPWR